MSSAWERNDVGAFASMLAEEATFAMPPLASWFAGRDAIARWAAQEPMSGLYRWRVLPARANGQLALGYYSEDGDGGWVPFALNVLTFRGTRDRECDRVHRAVVGAAGGRGASSSWSTSPWSDSLAHELFVRFGLPERLPD